MEHLPQKILLFSLYGLIILMVIFSLNAIKNLGFDGYTQCVKDKCDSRGEVYCSKQREISNCCQGAGGGLGMVNNQLSCVFN